MSQLMEIEPLQKSIPADRQGAKRHYGVHPYFTRRPYNVVRSYILRYSTEGDRVLDPFGGSGVTPIEAFLENRKGIQNDINPLANFIAGGVAGLAHGNHSEYKLALSDLKDRCQTRLASLQEADEVSLANLESSINLPENIRLPRSADVEHYRDLFSEGSMSNAPCVITRGRRSVVGQPGKLH